MVENHNLRSHVQILENLANGVNPISKEKLQDSFINERDIIRALQFAIDSINENANYVKKATELYLPFDKKFLLEKENLLEVVKEISFLGIKPTPMLIARVFIGSDSLNNKKLSELKFFSSLKGIAKFNKLKDKLEKFFLDNQEEISKNSYSDDDFKTFDLSIIPIFNKFKDTTLDKLRAKVNSIPIIKTENDFKDNPSIIELRKSYPRAYEPISEEETNLFNKALEYSNDAKILSEVFQRNLNSITARLKKHYFLKSKLG
ncbi:MAG: hypothetical protein U0457_16300 [Candidatus Sericytochromatia bacterium]